MLSHLRGESIDPSVILRSTLIYEFAKRSQESIKQSYMLTRLPGDIGSPSQEHDYLSSTPSALESSGMKTDIQVSS